MRRYSATVVIAGPDGAGKSSLAAEMVDRILAPPVIHLHHRPGLLPRSVAASQPVTEPHKRPPYSQFKSTAKLLYLWIDYQLGWWLRLRPVRRRGGAVIIERGWPDLAVDPLRYRLSGSRQLTAILGALIPRPDLVAVLLAEPELLVARADELPLAEISRQTREWSKWAEGRQNVIVLDAAAARDDSLRVIADELDKRRGLLS